MGWSRASARKQSTPGGSPTVSEFPVHAVPPRNALWKRVTKDNTGSGRPESDHATMHTIRCCQVRLIQPPDSFPNLWNVPQAF